MTLLHQYIFQDVSYYILQLLVSIPSSSPAVHPTLLVFKEIVSALKEHEKILREQNRLLCQHFGTEIPDSKGYTKASHPSEWMYLGQKNGVEDGIDTNRLLEHECLLNQKPFMCLPWENKGMQ